MLYCQDDPDGFVASCVFVSPLGGRNCIPACTDLMKLTPVGVMCSQGLRSPATQICSQFAPLLFVFSSLPPLVLIFV